MTSNFGSHTILDKFSNIDENNVAQVYDETKDVVFEELKQNFRPEFLNRIDDIIFFNSLTKEDIMKIIDIELASLIERLTALNYHIELTEEAKNFIADKGLDKDYGARPLKRAIQKYIEDPMAEEIINAVISEGDELILDLNEAKDGVNRQGYSSCMQDLAVDLIRFGD